jgi:glutamate-ammonia-ligase adenylyltransferase
MAMLRVGLLAGDPRMGDEALAVIRGAAYAAPLPADAAAQVIDMRRRLEQSVAGKDHLKRGPGGYVDHEFIAQFFSLGMPADEVLAASGSIATADVLTGLAKLGRIPTDAAVELLPGLELLRFIESRMRLSAGRAVSALPTTVVERTELARRCGFADLPAFNAAVEGARTTARRWFGRLIGGSW